MLGSSSRFYVQFPQNISKENLWLKIKEETEGRMLKIVKLVLRVFLRELSQARVAVDTYYSTAGPHLILGR